jgi:mannan endo-1,4-beta-mannosidase
MITRRDAALGAILIGGLAAWPGKLAARSNKPFVRVDGQRFFLGDETYRFAGTNVWYGAYLGAPTAYGNRDRLRKELDTLASSGLTNLRVLGASELSPLKNSLTTTFRTATSYNEDLLQGLDFLLAEMGKRDMKAVIFLNNFWEWSGGMVTYLYWTNGGHYVDLGDPAHPWPEFADFSAQFYSSPEAVALYLQYVNALITRTNTFTGVAYRDDPAIMAWELANEPRVGGSEAFVIPHLPAFYAWIQHSAQFIKARDPNHLVTTGSEGLRGCLELEDVTEKAHAIPEIDYMTFHLWPLNWSWINLKDLPGTYEQAEAKGRDHVRQHIAIAQKINKPLVAEEFGFPRDNGYAAGSPTTLRDRFYGMMFAEVLGSAGSGGPFAGTNFWTWGGSGRAQHEDYRMQPGDTSYVGDPPQEPQGANSVFDCDATTLEIIRAHAAALKTVAG